MTAEEQLHRALWGYHSAVQLRDGVEARLRRGDTDAELLDRTLRAAESTTRARVELYEVLIAQGWTPSAQVAHDLEQDRAVLRQQAV